jgi:TOMM system kinase/cyclase fusion protein
MPADPRQDAAPASSTSDDAPASSTNEIPPVSSRNELPPLSSRNDGAPASSRGDEPPLSSEPGRRLQLDQTMAAMLPAFQKRRSPATPSRPLSTPPPDSRPVDSRPVDSRPADSKPRVATPPPVSPPIREDDSITFLGDDDDDDDDGVPSSGSLGVGPNNTMMLPMPSTGPGTGSRLLRIPKKGDRIGGEDGRRFEIVERLGIGGMAVVFLAKDTVLDRTVAIKFVTIEVLSVAPAEVIERFKLEARASARLSHENIVRIFDLGTSNSVPFLIMEHLEGRPLDSIEMHQELDALGAVRIMADVARGLSHAHKAGIVHRDLKPSNVFIVKDGRAKIVDFGLASVAFGLDSRGTEWLALAGTPRYMSPEQWKGEPQDARTDIWAAGVMLFEMLVGRPPFPGDSLVDVRKLVLSREPATPVRKLRPDLPEEAGRLIERLLAKDATKRLPTADELLDGLVALEVALSRTIRRATQVAAAAKDQPRIQPERRQATFLSCALADLMPLSEELELDDFSALLDGFFEVCATVVRQLEGTVLTSLGGRVVACFGFPIAHEDDAQRAVRAGFLIAGALGGFPRRDGAPHAAQIGVHTSLAIASRLPGTGDDATPILQGEAPHVAMWLEEKARANEILMSRRTQMLVRNMFETEVVGGLTPEGATRAIETYRALRPDPTARPNEHGMAEGLTPLVGREAEVKELRSLWDRSRGGEGQFVMLAGEAGIGKSRLVELLKEQIATQPHHLVGCQSWLHFKNTAFYPVATGLRRIFGLTPEMPALDQLEKLEVFLSDLGIALDEHVPLFASLLSIPLSGGYVAPTLSPDLLKGKVIEAIVTTLLRLAAHEPTLLLLEDLHWSDTSTLELLGVLQGRMTSARLMLLMTFRPDFAPPWPERTNLHRITLARLTASQTVAMAAFASQGRNLPTEVVEQVVRRTDGIPLFVEELTRMVADAWEQATQKGEAVNVQTFASSTIPETLSELLLARLDRLADNGKEVAQLGAVLGREFPYALIERASTLDETSLRAGLMQLVEAGVMRPEGQGDETQYVFKHALIQDAAYQSLVRARRQEHHFRAAEVLVRHFPEATALHPELVGHHFAEAGRSDEAVGYFEKAGQRAVQRFANTDAVIHYSRAIEELRTLRARTERDRRELALQLALGAPLIATKGTAAPQVRETYARARELCQVADDGAQLFPTLLGLTQFYMVAAEPKIAVEIGQQLLSQAERSSDTTMQMLAHRSLGMSLTLRGNFVLAHEHNERGFAIYNREQHGKLALKYGQDPGVWCGGQLAWCLWFLGYADQALERAKDALQLARDVNHPLSIAFALYYLAAIHNHRREFETASQIADSSLKLALEHKLAQWVAMSNIQRGWALLGMGNHEEGAEQLRGGMEGWTKTGAKAGRTIFLSALIWGLWRAGQIDEAMHTLDEAEQMIMTQDERYFEAELLRLRGELMLAADASHKGAAIDCFHRSLEIAAQQRARAWELLTAMSLGRTLAREGRPGEAAGLLKPVLDWFTEGTDTSDLREARALLAEWQA